MNLAMCNSTKNDFISQKRSFSTHEHQSTTTTPTNTNTSTHISVNIDTMGELNYHNHGNHNIYHSNDILDGNTKSDNPKLLINTWWDHLFEQQTNSTLHLIEIADYYASTYFQNEEILEAQDDTSNGININPVRKRIKTTTIPNLMSSSSTLLSIHAYLRPILKSIVSRSFLPAVNINKRNINTIDLHFQDIIANQIISSKNIATIFASDLEYRDNSMISSIQWLKDINTLSTILFSSYDALEVFSTLRILEKRSIHSISKAGIEVDGGGGGGGDGEKEQANSDKMTDKIGDKTGEKIDNKMNQDNHLGDTMKNIRQQFQWYEFNTLTNILSYDNLSKIITLLLKSTDILNEMKLFLQFIDKNESYLLQTISYFTMYKLLRQLLISNNMDSESCSNENGEKTEKSEKNDNTTHNSYNDYELDDLLVLTQQNVSDNLEKTSFNFHQSIDQLLALQPIHNTYNTHKLSTITPIITIISFVISIGRLLEYKDLEDKIIQIYIDDIDMSKNISNRMVMPSMFNRGHISYSQQNTPNITFNSTYQTLQRFLLQIQYQLVIESYIDCFSFRQCIGDDIDEDSGSGSGSDDDSFSISAVHQYKTIRSAISSSKQLPFAKIPTTISTATTATTATTTATTIAESNSNSKTKTIDDMTIHNASDATDTNDANASNEECYGKLLQWYDPIQLSPSQTRKNTKKGANARKGNTNTSTKESSSNYPKYDTFQDNLTFCGVTWSWISISLDIHVTELRSLFPFLKSDFSLDFLRTNRVQNSSIYPLASISNITTITEAVGLKQISVLKRNIENKNAHQNLSTSAGVSMSSMSSMSSTTSNNTTPNILSNDMNAVKTVIDINDTNAIKSVNDVNNEITNLNTVTQPKTTNIYCDQDLYIYSIPGTISLLLSVVSDFCLLWTDTIMDVNKSQAKTEVKTDMKIDMKTETKTETKTIEPTATTTTTATATPTTNTTNTTITNTMIPTITPQMLSKVHKKFDTLFTKHPHFEQICMDFFHNISSYTNIYHEYINIFLQLRNYIPQKYIYKYISKEHRPLTSILSTAKLENVAKVAKIANSTRNQSTSSSTTPSSMLLKSNQSYSSEDKDKKRKKSVIFADELYQDENGYDYDKYDNYDNSYDDMNAYKSNTTNATNPIKALEYWKPSNWYSSRHHLSTSRIFQAEDPSINVHPLLLDEDVDIHSDYNNNTNTYTNTYSPSSLLPSYNKTFSNTLTDNKDIDPLNIISKIATTVSSRAVSRASSRAASRAASKPVSKSTSPILSPSTQQSLLPPLPIDHLDHLDTSNINHVQSNTNIYSYNQHQQYQQQYQQQPNHHTTEDGMILSKRHLLSLSFSLHPGNVDPTTTTTILTDYTTEKTVSPSQSGINTTKDDDTKNNGQHTRIAFYGILCPDENILKKTDKKHTTTQPLAPPSISPSTLVSSPTDTNTNVNSSTSTSTNANANTKKIVFGRPGPKKPTTTTLSPPNTTNTADTSNVSQDKTFTPPSTTSTIHTSTDNTNSDSTISISTSTSTSPSATTIHPQSPLYPMGMTYLVYPHNSVDSTGSLPLIPIIGDISLACNASSVAETLPEPLPSLSSSSLDTENNLYDSTSSQIGTRKPTTATTTTTTSLASTLGKNNSLNTVFQANRIAIMNQKWRTLYQDVVDDDSLPASSSSSSSLEVDDMLRANSLRKLGLNSQKNPSSAYCVSWKSPPCVLKCPNYIETTFQNFVQKTRDEFLKIQTQATKYEIEREKKTQPKGSLSTRIGTGTRNGTATGAGIENLDMNTKGKDLILPVEILTISPNVLSAELNIDNPTILTQIYENPKYIPFELEAEAEGDGDTDVDVDADRDANAEEEDIENVDVNAKGDININTNIDVVTTNGTTIAAAAATATTAVGDVDRNFNNQTNDKFIGKNDARYGHHENRMRYDEYDKTKSYDAYHTYDAYDKDRLYDKPYEKPYDTYQPQHQQHQHQQHPYDSYNRYDNTYTAYNKYDTYDDSYHKYNNYDKHKHIAVDTPASSHISAHIPTHAPAHVPATTPPYDYRDHYNSSTYHYNDRAYHHTNAHDHAYDRDRDRDRDEYTYPQRASNTSVDMDVRRTDAYYPPTNYYNNPNPNPGYDKYNYQDQYQSQPQYQSQHSREHHAPSHAHYTQHTRQHPDQHYTDPYRNTHTNTSSTQTQAHSYNEYYYSQNNTNPKY